jgi:hypothetical protein
MSSETIRRRLAKIEERVAPPADVAYVRIITLEPGDPRQGIGDFPEIAAERSQYRNSVVMII